MTKDYAKRAASKQNQRHGAKKIAWAKIILLLVVVALLAAFAWWMRAGMQHTAALKQHLPPVESITASKINSSKTSKGYVSNKGENSAKSQNESKSSSMDYQFYTLLSEIRVIDPDQNGQNLPGAEPGFWLQMAVYYTEKDADAMVERLQLLGMNPDVIQRLSESSNKILYYVAQGPYVTRALALQKQKDLQKLNLDSMIYEVKPLSD